MTTSTYGKKGGTSATAGKRASTYVVTLPDGTIMEKRVFGELLNPVGYVYQHDGKWFVAAVREANASHLNHYRQCPAALKR